MKRDPHVLCSPESAKQLTCKVASEVKSLLLRETVLLLTYPANLITHAVASGAFSSMFTVQKTVGPL